MSKSMWSKSMWKYGYDCGLANGKRWRVRNTLFWLCSGALLMILALWAAGWIPPPEPPVIVPPFD